MRFRVLVAWLNNSWTLLSINQTFYVHVNCRWIFGCVPSVPVDRTIRCACQVSQFCLRDWWL